MIGTGAVLAYAKRADQRAIFGQKAVSMLVATGAIPAGTSATDALDNGMLVRQSSCRPSSVPVDAVRSLTTDLAKLVTSYAMPPAQLLLRSMLVTAAQVTGASRFRQG